VAGAHGVDAGAQRVGLAIRAGLTRLGVADAQTAQVRVRPRLALVALVAVEPWWPIAARRALALLAGPRPVARAIAATLGLATPTTVRARPAGLLTLPTRLALAFAAAFTAALAFAAFLLADAL